MTHCFDVDIAKQYGILEAILLHYFEFWIQKNKANNANFHDGHYWTYNSLSAFVEMFPYASKSKISTALNNLEKEGLIATSNYNKSSYDRTKWYRLTDKGNAVLSAETVEKLDFLNLDNRCIENRKSIVKKSEMDSQEIGNGFTENRTPIPFNNHLDNTDSNTDISIEFEKLWAIYPKKQGKKDALKHYRKARKSGTTYEEVEQGINAYVDFIKANNKEMQFVKMGSSFFSQESWNDDWRASNEKQMGRFYDRATEQDSRGVAGATVGSGSGVRTGRVTFPRANFSLQEDDECEDRS